MHKTTMFIPLIFYVVGIAGGNHYGKTKLEEELVHKGYAAYHAKTREWHLCSGDEIVWNTYPFEKIEDIPIGISTASTYIKFLQNEVRERKMENEILEKQIWEKEQILDKIRKK